MTVIDMMKKLFLTIGTDLFEADPIGWDKVSAAE